MADPVDPNSAMEVAGHVAATAGGGTFLAGILEFFRSKERRQLAERVAALEGQVAVLHALLMPAPKLGKSTKRRRIRR